MHVYVYVMLSVCVDMLSSSLLCTLCLLFALLCDNHIAYVWAVFPSALLSSITCWPLWLTVSALHVWSAHFLLTYSSLIIAAFTASTLQDIGLQPFLMNFSLLFFLPLPLPRFLLHHLLLLIPFLHHPFLLPSFAHSSFLLPSLPSSIPPSNLFSSLPPFFRYLLFTSPFVPSSFLLSFLPSCFLPSLPTSFFPSSILPFHLSFLLLS